MAHVLIVSTGRTSLRNRCVELMRRLDRVGHRTTFAGPEGLRDALERNAVQFVPLETNAEPASPSPSTQDTGVLGKGRRWLERLRSAKTRRAAASKDLVDPRYGGLIAELQPDLILVDIELHPYVVASHALAPRTAILCPFIAPLKVAGVPPLHTPIQPGRGFAGSRLGIELAWLRYRAWKAKTHMLPRVAAPGSDRIAVLRELADSAGFPHRREFALYDWLLPLSFRNIPTLNLNAIEFDFPHHPHPSQRHTGPLIRVGRDDGAEVARPEESAALRRFLQDRLPDRPLIYCAFGTAFAGDDSDFIRRLIDAVRGRPDWDVVITLGGRSIGKRPDELPDHLQVFDWVPQLAILAHADCAVLHAGPGSIYECIHFEVPMVIYPFSVNDQPGYGARAAYHELGVLGDREADPPALIQDQIETVLSDTRYRDAVRRMSAKLKRYSEEDVAVQVVEELLVE